MEPFPITGMLQQIKRYTNNVGLYLPRLLNLEQLQEAALKPLERKEDAELSIYVLMVGLLQL